MFDTYSVRVIPKASKKMKDTNKQRFVLMIIFLASYVHMTNAWITLGVTSGNKKFRSLLKIKNEPSSDEKSSSSSSSSKGDINDRMEIIRSLQKTFYGTGDIKRQTKLNLESCTVTNLPLWRTKRIELIGRSNILHVHDPMYTNMFEGIIRSGPPHYFGNLYRNSRSSRISSDFNTTDVKLTSWDNEEHVEIVDLEEDMEFSAVLGTLMRIVDYRRIDDGRLLILVQAIERFTVTNVTQEKPYGIADVHLLPDLEEICNFHNENSINNARSMALTESFDEYLQYEFDSTTLPIPCKAELPVRAIGGSSLLEIIPFSLYSSNVELCSPAREITKPSFKSMNKILSDETSLEYQLDNKRIYNEPDIGPEYIESSSDNLEYNLWVTIDRLIYQRSKKKYIYPSLLGLLPRNRKWPKNFQLEKVLLNSTDTHQVQSEPDYPAYRRQKRLSYAAASLLEYMHEIPVHGFRHILLKIPSTQTRLAFLLQCFQEKFE